MFGWFRRWTKQAPTDADLAAMRSHPLIGRTISAMALAQAIKEVTLDYHQKVDSKAVIAPAIRREKPSVREVWEDSRTESAFPLISYGNASLMHLAEMAKQPQLFKAFVEERPHLKFPHRAAQELTHDSLQAMFQAFVYLQRVGEETCVDGTKVRARVKAFEQSAAKAAREWVEFEASIRDSTREMPPMPPLMIEMFWAEITMQAKEIALVRIFGTSPEEGLRGDLIFFEKQMRERGESEAEIFRQMELLREKVRLALEAKEPDDLTKVRDA